MMKRIYWWLYVVRLSFRWCWKFNLGDRVWFKGKQWVLNQGVADPFWNLVELADEDVRKFEDRVHRSLFRKVWTPRNVWGSFRSGYKFYMGYWYDIWVGGGIKPWMRGCNIWGDYKGKG